MDIEIKQPKKRPLYKGPTQAWYGPSQERFQVQEGDVWKIGDHVLICDSVVNAHKNGILDKFIGQVDVINTDPPWTPAIYKSFMRWAERTNDQLPFYEFLEVIVTILKKHCKGPIFLSSGLKLMPRLRSMLEQEGARTVKIATYGYTKAKDGRQTYYNVWVGSFGDIPLDPSILPDKNLFGDELQPFVAKLTCKPGVKFFDPLGGSFTFLHPAAALGATTYGVEIIPRKFAEGLRSMSAFGSPELIYRK